MAKNCLFCGEEIKNEDYYVDIFGKKYKITPGFDDIFVFCKDCCHVSLSRIIQEREFKFEELVHIKNGTLNLNWVKFLELKKQFSRLELVEMDLNYQDLIEFLVCLGFVTYNPHESWMFIKGHHNLPSLYHGTIFGCLFFKTRKDAENYWKAKKKSEKFLEKEAQLLHLVDISTI